MFNFLKKIFFSLSPRRTPQQKRGQLGERLAARYLAKEKRMKILEKNWKEGRHEIDLICLDGPQVVFVEVRARSVNAKVSGYYSISQKKRQHLRAGAYRYLNNTRPRPRHYRFDIVEVRIEGAKAAEIHHFSNADIF